MQIPKETLKKMTFAAATAGLITTGAVTAKVSLESPEIRESVNQIGEVCHRKANYLQQKYYELWYWAFPPAYTPCEACGMG